MDEASLGIGVQLIQNDINPEDSIEDRFKTAFRCARDGRIFFAYDDDTLYRCGIGAVYVGATDEEKQRIDSELRLLRGLASATSGVPVDWGAMMDQESETSRPELCHR